MGTRRISSLVACSLALCGALFASASPVAQASDASTTQAYIAANLKLVEVARSHLTAAEAAPLTVVLKGVREKCPLAAEHAPQDPESTHLSYEVIGAMVVASYRFDLPAIRTYVSAVAPLHWSSGAFTSKIHAYANKLKVLATLTAPNVCADVDAWVADDYRALPSTTLNFDRLFEPAWVRIGELPGSLPGESTSERPLMRRTDQLEELLIEGEARAAESYETIMDALDLKP